MTEEAMVPCPPPGRERRRKPTVDAMSRCRAVLAVWSESRRPSEICRELGIAAGVLLQWQERAMEGMLQALTPGTGLSKGSALPPRLQRILEKRQKAWAGKSAAEPRLANRLRKIQSETGASQVSSKTEPPA